MCVFFGCEKTTLTKYELIYSINTSFKFLVLDALLQDHVFFTINAQTKGRLMQQFLAIQRNLDVILCVEVLLFNVVVYATTIPSFQLKILKIIFWSVVHMLTYSSKPHTGKLSVTFTALVFYPSIYRCCINQD